MKVFWQKCKDVAASAVALAIFMLVSYAEIYFFVSGGFFSTNRLLYGYSFLSILLIALMSGSTIYFGINLYFSLYRPEIERKGALLFALELLTIVIGVVIPVMIYYVRTFEAATLLVTLPYFLAVLAALLFLFLIPLVRRNKLFAILAVVVMIGAVCGFGAVSANGEKVAFEADPVVLDNGESFSVVWCTNVASVGYLEYSYQGQTYTIYDEEGGRYVADRRVHSVRVPYDHLYGNTYTVSAAKVLRNASRFSKVGSFLTSKGYRFADKVTGGELKMLSLTDWHEKNDRLYAAAKDRDFDLLLLMGDAINYVNEFDDILNYVVIPGGKLTGGVKPAIFVRGNHEVRGPYAEEIRSALGLNEYYFTATYGEVNFLVMDGADDKADDDPQNGILTVCEAYRERELAEMEAVFLPASGYNICLCHIPFYSMGKEAESAPPLHATEQYDRFRALLEKHKVKLEISGHDHSLYFGEEKGIDLLIAGGPTEDQGYVSCMITVKAGVATIEAYNNEGTVATYGPIALS